MGGEVSQENKPVASFSRKFNSAQLKSPTIEQEFLAITETLKYCHCMLLGQKVIVWTDHRTFVGLSTKFQCDRVHLQRLLLREYGVDIKHIRCEQNIVADHIISPS